MTAPCNDASGHGYACVNVWYSSSTDGGTTWATHVKLTSVPTNPNFEQFGGRTVPFFGDYIMVAAGRNSVDAVWTEARHLVAGPDSDGADAPCEPHNLRPLTLSFRHFFHLTSELH